MQSDAPATELRAPLLTTMITFVVALASTCYYAVFASSYIMGFMTAFTAFLMGLIDKGTADEVALRASMAKFLSHRMIVLDWLELITVLAFSAALVWLIIALFLRHLNDSN